MRLASCTLVGMRQVGCIQSLDAVELETYPDAFVGWRVGGGRKTSLYWVFWVRGSRQREITEAALGFIAVVSKL
jgi:hypothetical protein